MCISFFSSKHVNITTIVTFVTLFGCIINTCSLHIINNYSNCIQQQKQVFINFLIIQSYGFFLFIFIFLNFFGPPPLCNLDLLVFSNFLCFFLLPLHNQELFFFYFSKTIWGQRGGLVCDVGTLAIIHRNILSNLNVGSNFF